jgi:two-component system OmpR family sensor kinase
VSKRLVALALAQLAVLALAAVAIAAFTMPRRPQQARATLERVVSALGDREDEARLREVGREHGVELTLRDDDRVIATTIDPPLVVFAQHTIGTTLESGAVLVMKLADPPPIWIGPVLMLLAGVIVLGAGALFTARWITRPLEALARTARAVGGGELSARTGLSRDDEIGHVARSVDEMAERLEGLMRAERELLANVSHELRTPLARIRVAMDLASEGDAEEARSAITEIASDLEELEGIVDDILAAMRFDVADRSAGTGLPLSSLRDVPADGVAKSAAERFRARHPNRPFELEVGEDVPSMIVDAVLIRRVIDNLLENAHKYTPDADRTIKLRVSEHAGNAVFEVTDRGIGIAEADLPHVFSPFFRADKSRSRGKGRPGGVGLGLTLAKRIVESHGGKITISSEEGAGTTVRVELEGSFRRRF